MATPRHKDAKQDREEIVVFSIVRESTCDECRVELPPRGFLVKREGKGLCLECAGLGDLWFLRRGDAALTRRASKHSRARVVVVRWSRARKHYERQGILVEEEALARAEQECFADAEVRARRRERAETLRMDRDEEYTRRFAKRVRELYPGCPEGEERAIAEWTCSKSTGRIGRSAAAKALDADAVDLAVRAHVRHRHTNYDELLYSGLDRESARDKVAGEVARVLEAWAGEP